MASTQPGRRLIASGFYVLDETQAANEPQRLNRVEYEAMAATGRGKRLIKSGFYVLDETQAANEPQRLNRVEYEAMAATGRGKRLIKSGFYVLDEGEVPGAPNLKLGRAPAALEVVRGKWTRQHCDFSALAALASH